jgi:CRP-like cAMP-binding protein
LNQHVPEENAACAALFARDASSVMNTEEDKHSAPPLSCADCSIGSYSIYGQMKLKTPNEISTLRRGTQQFQAQKTFLREGEVTSRIFTIYSGWAIRFQHLPEGRRQILSFLIPGDICVLESLYFPKLPLPFSVRSLTPVWVCGFNLGDMGKLTQVSPETTDGFASAARDYFIGLHRRLIDIGRRSALGRVAQIILELEKRLAERQLSKNGRFYFPVRQEDLADALGLHTVYVNRTLDRLRKKHIIEFDRQWMTVKDFEELKRIAEEE